VIENKPGGGGSVTATLLASKKPEKIDPKFPDIPTLAGLGYKDVPPSRFVLLAAKGLPDPIFKKLEAAFRKAAYLGEAVSSPA
jgi:tripartite-type tricarboxylate transporter receptor subunit TctC